MPRSGPTVILLLTFVVLFVGAKPVAAQIGSERYSSLVMDAGNGAVLSAISPDEPRHPASLTKMMTLYMVFEALRDRRIAIDELVPVSAEAAATAPSKLGLLPGSRLTVEQAILGLVTRSANDAAAAVGEMLGGDEQRFAQMMTLRARALGMTHTTFRNASGLPDPDQITTARDMAVLARHLVQDFPAEYRYFSAPSFVWRGRVILNHDRMLQTYPGADGIKTGFTEASGHNLVTSAVRGEIRLVGVVLGAASNPERDVHMAGLLDRGFEQLDVPVAPRRDIPVASRFGLIAGAQAAELTPPVRPAPVRVLAEAPPRPRMPPRWAVQVGAFRTEAAARQAAMAARRIVDAGEARVEAIAAHGRAIWRAQVAGLGSTDAHAACAALLRRHLPCAPLRVGGGEMASR